MRAPARAVWRRWNEAEPFCVPPHGDWPLALRRVRTAGLVVLGIELVLLCWWAVLLTNRWALTFDFVTHQQAAYLIAHGVLDPFNTNQGFPYRLDHAEFLFWPLAALQLVDGRPETLLWLQTAATVGAQAIAFLWICDIVAARAGDDAVMPAALAGLGALLLVANPWVSLALSFDVHTESFAALFAVWAARDLHRGRIPWTATALGLLAGDVSASYLGAVGISGVLCGRYALRRGATVAAVAFGWLVLLHVIGPIRGDAFAQYTNLAGPVPAGRAPQAAEIVRGVAEHPARVLTALWSNRANVWAYLAPFGLLGLLWPPVLVPLVLLVLESQLGVTGVFSAPSFQGILIAVLGPVGTVGVLSAVLRRSAPGHRWTMRIVVAVLAINVVGWAVVWIPGLPGRWLRVTPAAARTLDDVERMIRPADEVIAQNGISGRLASRRYSYVVEYAGSFRFPVRARRVWIVLAPNQGIEAPSSADIDSMIPRLLATPGMRLAADRNGVWAFEWTPRQGTTSLALRASGTQTAAGQVSGPSGEAVRDGPPSDWYTAGTYVPGYVVSGDYFLEPAGTYEAVVRIAASTGANVELWNARRSELLARASVGATGGPETVDLTVRLQATPASSPFDGWGPWRQSSVVTRGTLLEIRVWSPGGVDHVAVYRIGLRRVGGP